MGSITKDDHRLVKGLHLQTEKNGAKRLIKEFPNKRWSVANINRFNRTEVRQCMAVRCLSVLRTADSMIQDMIYAVKNLCMQS